MDADREGGCPPPAGHKVHDTLGEGDINRVVGERQFVRSANMGVQTGNALPHRFHEQLGWIDRSDRIHSQSLDEPSRQCAGSAPDIARTLPARDIDEFH